MPEVMIEEPGMSSGTATSTGTRILDADILSTLFLFFLRSQYDPLDLMDSRT